LPGTALLFDESELLLHIFLQAALFNQTDIALLLMDNGANIEIKNPQGWFVSFLPE
jgi:ankyrin repeat protein